jgi:hypothetical protein
MASAMEHHMPNPYYPSMQLLHTHDMSDLARATATAALASQAIHHLLAGGKISFPTPLFLHEITQMAPKSY